MPLSKGTVFCQSRDRPGEAVVLQALLEHVGHSRQKMPEDSTVPALVMFMFLKLI